MDDGRQDEAPGEGPGEGPADGADRARPLASLLVLGFNQERHTRAVVEAAFAQTYEPLEIVLSDDGSSDRTFAIMAAMAEGYRGPHRVVLNRNEPNRGIVGNVNRLMELSRGALVVKNDGDDVSEPARVERLVEAWEAGGRRAHLLVSDVLRIDEEGRTLDVLRLKEPGPLSTRRLIEDPTPWNVVSRNLFALGASMAWTRALWDRFGPIDERAVVEDSVIPFRAAVLGGGVVHLEEPLVRYRVGGLTAPDEAARYGHDQMYGVRLKINRLQMRSLQAMLADMDQVDFEDRARCRAEAEERALRLAHLVAMAEAGRGERWRRLPGSALLSLRRRSPFYAYINAKYALDRLAMAITDRRGRARGRTGGRTRGRAR